MMDHALQELLSVYSHGKLGYRGTAVKLVNEGCCHRAITLIRCPLWLSSMKGLVYENAISVCLCWCSTRGWTLDLLTASRALASRGVVGLTEQRAKFTLPKRDSNERWLFTIHWIVIQMLPGGIQSKGMNGSDSTRVWTCFVFRTRCKFHVLVVRATFRVRWAWWAIRYQKKKRNYTSKEAWESWTTDGERERAITYKWRYPNHYLVVPVFSIPCNISTAL